MAPDRQSLAARQLAWADAQLRACRLCPRRCGVNRAAGERGWCGAGAVPRYFLEFVNHSEEPEFSPSHALLLTGCNMGCLFCHTAEGQTTAEAPELTLPALDALVARGRQAGARNLNIYGGEPFVNLPGLLRLFADSAELPPLVWNTNLYGEAESLACLAGIPAVYLVDLKFGNDACAVQVAATPDYWRVLTARLAEVYRQAPEALLIRHLVMPGHLECCTRPALAWVAANLPQVRVSLRTGYLVMPKARADRALGRFLTPAEIAAAQALAAEYGLRTVPAGALSQRETARGACLPPAGQAEKAVDVEIVMSPDGRLFLRNAPQAMVALVQEIANGDAAAGPVASPRQSRAETKETETPRS